MDSVTNVSEIAHEPLFAQHVRCIEISRYSLRNDESFEPLLDPSFATAGPEAIALMKKAYNCEIQSYRAFRAELPSKIGNRIGSRFTRLKRIVYPDLFDPRAPMDGMYQGGRLREDSELYQRAGVRLLQDEQWASDTIGLRELGVILPQCKPLTLEVPEINYWDYRRYFKWLVPGAHAWLSDVKKFRLTFRVWPCDQKSLLEIPSCQALSVILPALENLSLGFTFLPLEPRGNECCYFFSDPARDVFTGPSTLIKSFLSCSYPHLVHLTLEWPTVTMADLCDFMRRHRGTLESVSIQNMRLDGWEHDDESIMSSMTNLVCFLHDETQLTTVKVEGCFFDQHYTRVLHCVAGDDSCILHRVQEYICHRGEFPFRVLQPYLEQLSAGDLKVAASSDAKYTVKAPHEALIELTPESDDSWWYESRSNPDGDNRIRNIHDLWY